MSWLTKIAQSPMEWTFAEYDGKRQFILKIEGQEVGEISTIARPDENREVSNVLVWPKFQRKGYGTILYKKAKEDTDKLGVKLFISSNRTEDAINLHNKFEQKGWLKPSGELNLL